MGELIPLLHCNTVGISGGRVTSSNAKQLCFISGIKSETEEVWSAAIISLPNWTTTEKSSNDSWKERTNCRRYNTLGINSLDI